MSKITKVCLFLLAFLILLYIPNSFADEDVISDEILKNNLINNGYDTNGDEMISSDELSMLRELCITADDGELPSIWYELNTYAVNLSSIVIRGVYVEDAYFLEDIIDLDITSIEFYETEIYDIYSVSCFPNLRRLVVVDGLLENISFLEELTNLEELDLSRNYNLNDISAISSLTNLKKLNIESCDISELPDFSEITSFHEDDSDAEINFKNNYGLYDMSSLEETTFTALDISCTSIYDLSVLATMPYLESFNASDCQNLEDLSYLNNVSSLRSCFISGASLWEVSFYDLEELQDLTVIRSGVMSLSLSNLPNIRNINFEGNELMEVPAMEELGSNIHIINLNYNHIGNIGALASLKPSSVDIIYMFENGINPWEESGENFHAICTLQENNIDLQLGDCSEFEEYMPEDDDPEDIVKDNILLRYCIDHGIDVDNNEKISIDELKNLTSLEIDTDYDFPNSFSCIKYAENLESLSITGITLHDLSFLSEFRDINLISLSIESTELSELSGLEFLSSLNSLTIANSGVSDFSLLSYLENLEYLNIDSNTCIVNKFSISNLSKLKNISIYTSPIVEVELRNLESLKNLFLTNTDIEIATFVNLPNLETLNMSNNNLMAIPDISECSKLVIISMNYNQISDISMLTSFPALRTAYFIGNEINPWEETGATFHVMCTLEENNVDFQIGDYSRFEPEAEDPEDIVKDEILKAYLIHEGFDTDGNNKLSVEEIEKVNSLVFDNDTGLPLSFSCVKYMTSLNDLRIFDIELDNLNFLRPFKDTDVKELYLNHNSLSSISGIENLTSLTRVDLYDNEVVDISLLENLTELVQLKLSNNKIQNASVVSGLTKLTDIELDNNELTAVPTLSSIGAFGIGSMEYGRITVDMNPNLTDISGFANTNLRSLFLFATNVSNISVARQMPNIEYVTIVGNPNLLDVSILNEVTSLKSITINNCPIESISLSNLTYLSSLNLAKNRLNSVQFTNLPSLENISFENNNLNQLPDFTSCGNKIRYMNINNNHISDISNLSVITPEEGKSAVIYMYGNEVNPWEKTGATFHVMCTLEENRVNLQLGDCSRFDPGDEVEDCLTGRGKELATDVIVDGEEICVLPLDTGEDVDKENLIEDNFIVPDGGRIEIVDKDGNPIADGHKVGSRSVVTVYDSADRVVGTYLIAVKGDITGNGELALFDAFKILVGVLVDPTGENLDAIDIIIRDFNDDGTIALFDAFKFLIKAIT